MNISMVDWEWKYHSDTAKNDRKIEFSFDVVSLRSSMTKNNNNFQLISQITVTNAEKMGDCLQLL